MDIVEKEQMTLSIPKHLLKYFSLCEESDGERNIAKCYVCGTKIKASLKATSNFITHLKRCNEKKYEEYLKEKQADSEKKNNVRLNGSNSSSQKQQSLLSYMNVEKSEKFSRNDIRQRKLMKKLMLSIACDQLPLNIVDSCTFRDLLQEAEPRFVIPSRSTIRNTLLPEYTTKMETAMKEEFKDLSRVYLTLDLWTNRKMISFLGATIHFINSDWDLKSRVLACDVFSERHTAINIATAYEELVDRFNIRGKVKKVVADNASSMVKAFDVSLPGFHIDELEDTFALQDSLQEADIFEADIEMESVLQFLPERMSCFAHTQQLCVRDGLNHPEVKTSFLAVALQKTSSLVSSIRRSTSAAPFLQAKGISLQCPNVTRWNSQLKMVKSFLKNPEDVNAAVDLLSGREKQYRKLSRLEIAALTEVVRVLDPFREAMEEVEGQKKVTISSIGPVILGLKQSMHQLLHSELTYCKTLTRILVESINRRLSPFLEMIDVKAAAFFDPRFKLDWLPSQEAKDQLLQEIKVLLESKIEKEKVIERTIPLAPSKRPRLYSFMPHEAKGEQVSHPDEIKKLLLEYANECCAPFDVDPLSYWRDSPLKMRSLKHLAREMLGCTATSAPSERVFSIAGNFFTPNRAQLGAASFRGLLLLKCNREIYDNMRT